MMRGSAYYLDRPFTFKELPDWLSGLNGLRTRNDFHARGAGVSKVRDLDDTVVDSWYSYVPY